jgi:protein-tyrosine phosphatase
VNWVELEGACNVRDLGGLTTVDGRTTRSGVLLRSDNLQDLTPSDVSLLRGRGVRTLPRWS